MEEKKPTWKTFILPFKITNTTLKAVLVELPNTHLSFWHPCKLTKKVKDEIHISYTDNWKFRLTSEKLKYTLNDKQMERLIETDNTMVIHDILLEASNIKDKWIKKKYKPKSNFMDFKLPSNINFRVKRDGPSRWRR